MKNYIKIFGIIFVVTVICFSISACPEEDSGFNFVGTWESPVVGTGTEAVFQQIVAKDGGTFDYNVSTGGTVAKVDAASGTFTVSGDEVTLKPSTGAETKVKVSDNKFTLGNYTFTKK